MEKLIAGLELERRIVLQNDLPYSDVKDFLSREEEQSFPGAELVNEIKKYIGLLMVNLVSVINPEVIILGGGIGKHFAVKYHDYFQDFLAAHVPYVPLLVPPSLDEKANLLGAVAYALRNLHSDYSSLGMNKLTKT